MSENLCVRCGRPTPDGQACTAETRQAERQLAEIGDLAPIAEEIAHGLSRPQSSGTGAGIPGPRFPLDLASGAKCDGVTTALTKWVDHIGVQRGTTRPWFTQTGNPTTIAAHWLTNHLEWIRHQPDREPDDNGNTWGADQFLTDIDACQRILRSVTRGPTELRYLGPCGAEFDIGTMDEPDRTMTCEGDVYGVPGAEKGRCKTCGATVDQADRLKWIDDLRREWLYTATEIAEAYEGIKANTISQWASRGLLIAHGKHGNSPLYLVGEVLDLAAGDAARREEARAARARRREAVEMGA